LTCNASTSAVHYQPHYLFLLKYLIERHAEAGVPPRVEYALTALGRSLVEGPMVALGRWALEHGDELLEARERG
jgi:DNA-binding HxlR family transcriptional regulator